MFKSSIKVLALMSVAAPTLASGSYDYLSGGALFQYTQNPFTQELDKDAKLTDTNKSFGMYLDFSKDFEDSIFVTGRIHDFESVKSWVAGVGYHYDINPQFSVYGMLGIEKVAFDFTKGPLAYLTSDVRKFGKADLAEINKLVDEVEKSLQTDVTAKKAAVAILENKEAKIDDKDLSEVIYQQQQLDELLRIAKEKAIEAYTSASTDLSTAYTKVNKEIADLNLHIATLKTINENFGLTVNIPSDNKDTPWVLSPPLTDLNARVSKVNALKTDFNAALQNLIASGLPVANLKKAVKDTFTEATSTVKTALESNRDHWITIYKAPKLSAAQQALATAQEKLSKIASAAAPFKSMSDVIATVSTSTEKKDADKKDADKKDADKKSTDKETTETKATDSKVVTTKTKEKEFHAIIKNLLQTLSETGDEAAKKEADKFKTDNKDKLAYMAEPEYAGTAAIQFRGSLRPTGEIGVRGQFCDDKLGVGAAFRVAKHNALYDLWQFEGRAHAHYTISSRVGIEAGYVGKFLKLEGNAAAGKKNPFIHGMNLGLRIQL